MKALIVYSDSHGEQEFSGPTALGVWIQNEAQAVDLFRVHVGFKTHVVAFDHGVETPGQTEVRFITETTDTDTFADTDKAINRFVELLGDVDLFEQP